MALGNEFTVGTADYSSLPQDGAYVCTSFTGGHTGNLQFITSVDDLKNGSIYVRYDRGYPEDAEGHIPELRISLSVKGDMDAIADADIGLMLDHVNAVLKHTPSSGDPFLERLQRGEL